MKGHYLNVLALLATSAQYVNCQLDGLDHALVIMGSSMPRDLDSDTEAVWSESLANPDATRSASFKPFELYISQVPELAEVEWTWRINISTVPLESDQHIISTSYDFSWPSGGNVTAAMDGSTQPFCITGLTDAQVDFPANVSSIYTYEMGDSTACGPVLGDACVEAILTTGGTSIDDDEGKCVGPAKAWTSLPECADTVGTLPGPGFGSGTVNMNASFETGDGIWGRTSDPFEPGTADELDKAKERLHVFMVDTRVRLDGGAGGWISKPQLLCMRVETSEPSEGSGDEEDGTDGGNNDGDDGNTNGDETPESMGSAIRSKLGTTVAACAFGVFVFMI